MTTRSTRRNRTEDLVVLSNAELARVERENRQNRPNSADMGDQGNQGMAAQLQQLQQQIEQMRKAQQDREPQPQASIGDRDNPHTFYQNRSAIVPPPIQRQDFKIDPNMINLVKSHLFNGLPAENPMDHIENFEEICSTTSSNGVPADFLKCKLFPFSLANKASRWLKSLPPGSLTSWEQCRSAFLDYFYTKSKTASLRTKIASFHQYDGEAFCEAWERYKEYRRECPHHGFTDEQILGIFYDGVNWDYRNILNSASNGDFMTKSKEGAFELIENLAASSSSKSAEYDRTVSSVSAKGNGVEAQKIDELTAKVNLLLKASQKSVHFIDGNDDTPISQEFGVGEDEDDQMEVNYVNGQAFVQNRGFNQNYKSHPNLSYRSTNVENPQDQVYPPRSNQNQQGFQKSYSNTFEEKTFVPSQKNFGQQKVQFSNQQQAPNSSTNANDELKSMMQQMLANQQKSSAEINSRIDTMYNDLNGKIDAVWTHVKKLDVQVAQTAEAVKRPHGTLPGKGETNPREHCHAVTIHGEMETIPERRVLGAAKSEGQGKGVEDVAGAVDDDLDMRPVYTAPPPYVPKVPYPVPPKHLMKPISPEKLAGFYKMVRRFPPNISFEEALERRPLCHFFVNCRESLEDIKALFVKANSSPQPLKHLPKVEDPGKFAVPCSIAGVRFEESLCDSGSSVNLMSRAIAERLRVADINPPGFTLIFANSSTTTPYGTIPNLSVQVGNCLVPTDFQVVEMSEDSDVPLILGRPFLATVGAVVDLPNKRVSFSFIDEKVFYKAIPTTGTTKLASCVSIVKGERLGVDPQNEPCDVRVKEVLDGDSHISMKEVSKKEMVEGLVKSKRVGVDPYITLLPQRLVGDTIEYEVKCRGTSKPFSKVRAILTPELKEKGRDAAKGLLNRVLKLQMSDCGTCFGASSSVHPD